MKRHTITQVGIIMLALLASGAAGASDYGCKVLLCLANPGGPTQYGECVPPINQLWYDLRKGRGFPTCEQAAGSNVVQKETHYDICQGGLTSLAAGKKAITKTEYEAQKTVQNQVNDWDEQQGRGPPSPKIYAGDEDGQVCVSEKIQDTTVRVRSGGYRWRNVVVSVHDKIVAAQAKGSGNAFDVYIENKLHNRVLW